jgi:hypothetical protein
MKNKVEIFIKVSGGNFVAVDVLEFPYRLNRVSFSTDSDKLKSLGGTTSTQIKLAKTKKNNQVFLSRTDFKSVGKFNNFRDFEAKILENGAQVAAGVFKLEAVTSKEYSGTFFDNDANWIDRLGNIKLNELGYVDGQPTWLVPFDGTITINAVNDLSNRETDFVCPLIQYNNTPILDYLDLTNEQIFELDKQFPRDFELRNGFFGNRLGLNYNDILPAVYYRNILERIFAEIGLSVDCPLFYEPWFNALILPYVGSREYQFNWKNIASVYSENPFVNQVGEDNIDEIKYQEGEPSGVYLKRDALPLIAGFPPDNWGFQEIFRYKKALIIKHDDWDNTLVEKISLVNNFNTFGLYEVQADGNYTIEVNSQIENDTNAFYQVFDPPAINYFGYGIFEAYGAWNADSGLGYGLDRYKNHFGADENLLVVLRLNENNQGNYSETEQMLYQWLNGQNVDFTENQSDVIAYYSPKRQRVLEDYGGVLPSQISGSPISDFENQVEVINNFTGHEILFSTKFSDRLLSRSYAHIKVSADLKKGEKVQMFWLSLANVEFTFDTLPLPTIPEPAYACDPATGVIQRFGTEAAVLEEIADYSISFNCGSYDLDLAANLPPITAKEFVGDFIKQYNQHFFREGDTVQFTPIEQYYSPETYDITPRVDWGRGWESQPIPTPKLWIVGYDVDGKDKLLAETFNICTGQSKLAAGNYGNVIVENQNAYAEGQVVDTVLFSSTKFIDANCIVVQRVADAMFLPTETDPISGFVLQTGIKMPFLQPETQLGGLQVPSIQSADSAKTKLFGDLNRDFDYTARLLYHLGTANQYYGLNAEYQIIIGYPRVICDGVASTDFVRKAKHWFRPTLSQFDLENSVITGIEYPTLRFDTANGLYSRYFENLVELYNLSEQFTIQVAIRASDWANLKGYKKVIFQDQLYRLMEIRDYDPVSKEVCIIILLKEV